MCKLLNCNKFSKSSKTLHCHFVQKHFDNTWFFVCNQPIVNDVIYHFDTIHSRCYCIMGSIALHTRSKKINISPIPSYVSYGKPKGVMARALALTQTTITNAILKTFAMGNHNLRVIKVCMHEILEKLMPRH